ncbi:MAG: sensor histidine kinase [Bacillota bacterium]|jgi:signal transduction histidine kinase
MAIQDILPIVIPGAIVQVLIQIYFIRHCWLHPQLSVHRKRLIILAIALFNIPAAAIYLLATNRSRLHTEGLKDAEIDNDVRQGIFVLLLVVYEVLSLRIIALNLGKPRYPVIIGLLAACFLLMIINGLLVSKRQRLLYHLLPALQIGLILPIEYLDASHSAQFIVLLVIAGVITNFPPRLAQLYSIAAFGGYFAVTLTTGLTRYGGVTSETAISYVYANTLVFLLVWAAFYSLKKQLLANQQLQTALLQLRKQSLQLEQMSAIAERNRIAGEIHDTVGHALTSALISIEAGQQLLDSDREAAQEKLALARGQVQQGLQDIRDSVRAIQAGNQGERAFLPRLQQLLHEIRQNTGLYISEIVELKTTLLPIQQDVLLRAIKECATNSLKHGQSTEADLLLQEYRGGVHLTFRDNGRGADARALGMGFGLSSMRQRVESIGGQLAVESEPGEGFAVQISIPTGTGGGR